MASSWLKLDLSFSLPRLSFAALEDDCVESWVTSSIESRMVCIPSFSFCIFPINSSLLSLRLFSCSIRASVIFPDIPCPYCCEYNAILVHCQRLLYLELGGYEAVRIERRLRSRG